MKKLLSLLILAFIINACEKVVVIDLNIADPRIIIEGVVSNVEDGVFVRISETTSYFDSSNTSKTVSRAKVEISDNLGNYEMLQETDSGYYKASIIKGVEGRIYHLEVEIDGEKYEAESTMKSIPVLDSITFKETLYFDVNNQRFDTTFIAYSHFVDPSDTEDNYRIKLYVGKKKRLRKYFYLFEDNLINGDTIHYGTYGKLKEGVNARIELLNVDQAVYDYYHILNQVLNSSINAGSSISSFPQNPPSNISNGALGYFGALAIARKDTIVE